VTDYGFSPRWNGDGTEIYFLTRDGGFMAAAVTDLDSELDIDTPVRLFRAQIGGPGFNHRYAVTSDGRFYVNVDDVDESPPPIRVIQNSTAFDGRN